MSRDYNVVFENTPEMGGYAFLRTIVNFPSEAYFKEKYTPNTREKILDQGLKTYEEAALLCHMTPSVCYYLSAIEEIFETGEANLELLDYYLTKAEIGAGDVRKSRNISGLTYKEPEGLEEHILRLCEDRSTLKAEMFADVYDSYIVYADYVDPHTVKVLIHSAIKSVK